MNIGKKDFFYFDIIIVYRITKGNDFCSGGNRT